VYITMRVFYRTLKVSSSQTSWSSKLSQAIEQSDHFL